MSVDAASNHPMSGNAPKPRLIRRSTAALPLASAPPIFAVAAQDTLHLVAMAPGNRAAVHATLDRDGMLASAPAALPISIVSAAACGAGAVVAGVVEDGSRQALCVDAAGTVWSRTRLDILPAALVWMVPVCIQGEPALVWEAERENSGELGVEYGLGGSAARATTTVQPGVAFGLGAAAIGSSVFVLRSRGVQRASDVLRIERGEVAARRESAPNAHAIAAVGDRLAVLAWTPYAVSLDWLDTTLATADGAQVVATAQPPSWIRYATLHAADEHRIAVSYLVDSPGDRGQPPGAGSEPVAQTRHFVGRYDGASRTLADVSEIEPAGAAALSAAWLGERLFFVHATTGAALSLFDLARALPAKRAHHR